MIYCLYLLLQAVQFTIFCFQVLQVGFAGWLTAGTVIYYLGSQFPPAVDVYISPQPSEKPIKLPRFNFSPEVGQIFFYLFEHLRSIKVTQRIGREVAEHSH